MPHNNQSLDMYKDYGETTVQLNIEKHIDRQRARERVRHIQEEEPKWRFIVKMQKTDNFVFIGRKMFIIHIVLQYSSYFSAQLLYRCSLITVL